MPPSLPGRVIEALRQTVLLRDDAALTDGQLLERYLRQRDETAFAALVHRHGPMVWGVCRRMLVHHQDGEDAFQATFVVLVRKAASVRPRELVGSWLHGVAQRIALNVRRGRGRRRQREQPVTAMPEPAAAEDQPQRDLQALLDQELGRLPEKYRTAIIQCDLAGRTRKDVARQLGIPEGTLSGRLSRGRALLARRLARCGLAVSAAALTEPATAAPVAVVAAAIRMATGPATLVPARVAAHVEGVLKAMLMTKLKLTTFVLLAIALLGVAASVGPWGTATDAGDKGDQPGQLAQPPVQAPKPAPKPKGDAPAPDGDAVFGVYALRHAKATDMAKTLQELLQGSDMVGLRIAADPASNSVLVRGRPDQYKKVADFIRRLDQAARDAEAEPTAAGKPKIQVFALKYADAVEMAKTLRELLQGNDAPGLRIAADPGSNSVLVRCRRDQIAEVEGILMRLEDAAHAHVERRLKREKPAK